MTNSNKEKQTSIHAAKELTCIRCGERFIFSRSNQKLYEQNNWLAPKHCPSCHKHARAQQKKARAQANEQINNEKWERKQAADQKKFDASLMHWPTISINDIHLKNDHVLYVIGNGFDLMHGVKSSYYNFKDSLGKRNQLRVTLEDYLTPDDIWSDFEDALAHFDVSSMCNPYAIDTLLDCMGAYDDDSGAAEFFAASDIAASPLQTIAQDLPRRLRMWVETLCIRTEDRPLKKLFRKGKVLCFNYTEFVEKLYEIPEQNICYIHGCRRKKNYRPKDKLIMGHMPGASDAAFDFDNSSCKTINSPYKRELILIAQENALQLITAHDEALTKNCGKIIAAHSSFFSSLNEIENIVVIGHSFSPIDWDYFSEIATNLSVSNHVHWYFGCHSLRDLENLKQMLEKLNIKSSNISIFRTDQIKVTLMPEEKPKPPINKPPKEKLLCISPDNAWAVKAVTNRLSIINLEQQTLNYEVQFPTDISRAFFFPSGDYIAIIIREEYTSVFLFHLDNGRWHFHNELESPPNQKLLTSRLRHVFLTEQKLTFVYNNRIRKFSLLDGSLISNQCKGNARDQSYAGEEITGFLPR